MIKESVQKAINDQIAKEFYSSYLYLAMAAHFDGEGLGGFAKWMKLQAQEEWGHGMKLYEFLNDRGGKVVLEAIDKPSADFGSCQDIFKQVLDHERKVTASINSLYELAVKENDYPTQTHLHWFIDEQVEEEKTAEDILQQIETIGDAKHMLLMLDRHLGARQG